jgi:hypothetical protein
MPLQHPLSVDEDSLENEFVPALSPGAAGVVIRLGHATEEGRWEWYEDLHKTIRQTLTRHWLIRRAVVTTEVERYGMVYKLHEVELTARGRLWYNRWHAQASKGA